MFYKDNEPYCHKLSRTHHKIANWLEYDRALRRRGSLTVWVAPDALAAWHPGPEPCLDLADPRRIVATGENRMDNSVLAARQGGVLALTLNRPERLNAMTAPMTAALLAALIGAEADAGVRAVLLRGAGRGFCAGQDLAEVAPGQDLGDTLEQRFNPLVRALRASPLPVVCAVHGVAAGAGANLAFACDIVLAAQSARFIQSFIRIGLVPDAGGTHALPRLAGDARARGMALLGEPVSGAQAEAWGLVWRAVPDDDLFPEAERIAAQLAAQPAGAMALTKRALNAAQGNTLDLQLDMERDLQRACGASADFREGMQAFLEKRPAQFGPRTP